MNSYSHLVLAKQLEPAIKPEDSGEYLWGSVAADIRRVQGNQNDFSLRLGIEQIHTELS
jgi:hypothetical protein